MLSFILPKVLSAYRFCHGSKFICFSLTVGFTAQSRGKRKKKKAQVQFPAQILQVTVLLAETASFITPQGIFAAKKTDNNNMAHLAPERKSGTYGKFPLTLAQEHDLVIYLYILELNQVHVKKRSDLFLLC